MVKIGFLRVAVWLMLAVGISACGGGSSSNSSSSGTVHNFSVGQNGTNSSPWGDGTATHQPAMAVKLTPTTYPVTLTSVTIYANNNTGAEQLFNVRGFGDLSTGAEIFPPVLNQSIPVTGTSYFAKTVTIPPATISSGSFYIAIEWVTKPLSSASGANAFFLHTDSHLDFPNSSFIKFSGTTWSTLESVSATSCDLGIIANYGDVAILEKPAIAAAIPGNGAAGVSRGTQEVAIQFGKEMGPGYSVAGDANWPLSSGTPTRWSADHRTFYISRDNAASLLPAGSQIHLTLNDPGHPLSFMDIFGNTLDPSTISFTTGQ